MKIKFSNFGPIKSFETSLDANFLLILGENNIGKSYAISLVYVLLKTLTNNDILERPFISGYLLDDIARKIPTGTRDDFLRRYKAIEGRRKGIDATEVYRLSLIECLRVIFLDQFEKSILGTYGEISNLENRRGGESTAIEITTDSFAVTLRIVGGKVSIHDLLIPNTVCVRAIKQKRSPKLVGDQKVLYGPLDDPLSALNNIVGSALNEITSFVLETISGISDVHYLPASRSGLYQALSAFGQIIAELSKQRSFLSQRIELPAISEPLVDYFIKLTEIKPSKKIEGSKYYEIADELERNVLGGAVEFDAKSKRLFYKPFGIDLRLDLSSTSSMVSEVAPIATYLRHVLPNNPRRFIRRFRGVKSDAPRRKQILFIEEPEAHLHPKTQVLLMQSFARLASECDIKIVMTSHSNFVFNKLSNLIISGVLPVDGTKAYIFSRTDAGTVGRELEVDDYGISDENFTEVSEEIFNEKLELIESRETPQRGNDAV